MDTPPRPRHQLDSLPLLHVASKLSLGLFAVFVYSLLVWWIDTLVGVQMPNWSFEAGLLNTLILGILLGFRNRAAYDRWWEARRLWGHLTNDTRNLSVMLSAFVPAEVLARSAMAHLLVNFAVTLKLHLRGHAPDLRELPGLESETSRPTHLPSFLAGRMYQLLADWNRQGILADVALRAILPVQRGLLDVCGACERIRNTALAPSYKVLLRAGIAIDLALTPWYSMSQLGLWGLPPLLLVAFFLLGVELIDSVVEEPFGTERDDLALEQYCATIRESVEASLPGGKVPTATPEPLAGSH